MPQKSLRNFRLEKMLHGTKSAGAPPPPPHGSQLCATKMARLMFVRVYLMFVRAIQTTFS
jgi:hypothetical protein